jgi:hypothetical protein
MKDALKTIARKVTLELIYEVVDERTKEIKDELEKLQLRTEQQYGALNGRIDALTNRMEQQYMALNARIDQLFSLFLQERKA